MTLDEAIAVFDKSADPNAQTEAWAVIRAELANARRYSWLRSSGRICANRHSVIGLPGWEMDKGDRVDLDAAIDAAIAQQEAAHDH